jgi:hypothetical protein
LLVSPNRLSLPEVTTLCRPADAGQTDHIFLQAVRLPLPIDFFLPSQHLAMSFSSAIIHAPVLRRMLILLLPRYLKNIGQIHSQPPGGLLQSPRFPVQAVRVAYPEQKQGNR